MTKTRSEKMAADKIDREIDRIYTENCQGVQVSVLDIGKIFAEGRRAAKEGRDIKAAIVSFVETIRKN